MKDEELLSAGRKLAELQEEGERYARLMEGEIYLLEACHRALFYLESNAIQTAMDTLRDAIGFVNGIPAPIDQADMERWKNEVLAAIP